MDVVAPSASVAVSVNVSVPAAVGVPLTIRPPVPLAGTVNPVIGPWMLLTAKVSVPVPPLAVIVWL